MIASGKKKEGARGESGREQFWDLKLYVTDQTPRSMLAIDNLKKFCGEYLKGRCRIQVVDVLKDPRTAVENQIAATPTLVRDSPRMRIIGDLSRTEKVMLGLGVIARPAGEFCG